MRSEASGRTRHAEQLFAGIAPQYPWMGAILSLGQDPLWRRFLVGRVILPQGSLVLDVATGTGLVARALARRGALVVGLDASEPMLKAGTGDWRVLGRAEALPFPDASFDALTFTYLLRYVDRPKDVLAELARVVKPGGTVACLEFGVPRRRWAYEAWRLYTRKVMSSIGRLASPEWAATGRFLGPSIERHWEEHPVEEQLSWWRDAGIGGVRMRSLSLGAAVVTWGTRR